MTVPTVVAHRGYASAFPENTLLALEGALAGGVCWLELDVQFCRDGLPVVFHDDNLQRMCGESLSLLDLDRHQVLTHAPYAPLQFGERFKQTARIPTLKDVVELADRHPQARFFIEIKEEALRDFSGRELVLRTMQELEPIASRCVLISFSYPILQAARLLSDLPIGWVLSAFTPGMYSQAQELAPEFLIINYKKVSPVENLWPGAWQWLGYEVTSPELALELAARGFLWVEGMDAPRLLLDTRLKARACQHG